MIERWIEGAPIKIRDAELPSRVGAYLAFRAAAFPEPGAGADLARLRAMAWANIAEAFGDAAARAAFPPLAQSQVAMLQAEVRPVSVDARLHAWEWIADKGTVLKIDAVDHAEAHDLVGAQDIAWDVAGAWTELGFGEAARAELLAAMPAALRPSRALIEALIPC